MITFENLCFYDFDYTQWSGRSPFIIKRDFNYLKKGKEARLKFPNGYSIRVLLGKFWNSNGIDTYEIQVYKQHSRYNDSFITWENTNYVEKEKINDILLYVQNLESVIIKKKKIRMIPDKKEIERIDSKWIISKMKILGISHKQLHKRTSIPKYKINEILNNNDILDEIDKVAIFNLFRYLEKSKKLGF